MATVRAMAEFLDRELNVAAFPDDSHNGLQVQNSGAVQCVVAGVDASMAFFEKAAARKAALLVCHHGLSWGDSFKRITGLNYRRLKYLLDRDMALYACHLPLDAHPRLGNNAQICRALGLRGVRPFGRYHGVAIGFRGALPRPMAYAAFKTRVRAPFGHTLDAMDFGKSSVRTVAVVSGGAAEEVAEAGESGIDVYISGEPKLMAWHLAQEYGIHAIFAGHYATEVFGVKAVANLLAARFHVRAEFVDMAVPF